MSVAANLERHLVIPEQARPHGRPAQSYLSLKMIVVSSHRTEDLTFLCCVTGRIVMASIMRRRNGLMASSVMGIFQSGVRGC